MKTHYLPIMIDGLAPRNFKVGIKEGAKLHLTEKRRPKFFYGYVIVIASFIIMVMIWGMWATFGVFFESFLIEFGWTRTIISGATSFNCILLGLLCIFSAGLTDRFGPRRVTSLCGLFLGSGYLLMSRINTPWQLYLIFGVIIAIGMSAYIPILSIVAKWFDKRRGMMTGIVFTGMGLGTMVMPPLASRLISIYEWRTSYVIIGIVSLVVTILAAQFLKNAPEITGQSSQDYDELLENSLVSEEELSLKQAFHTRQFWLICALYFFFLYCLLTIIVHSVIHATGLGIAAASAANILAIIGGLCIVGMNVVGSTADKIGNRLSLIFSFVIMAIALFWLVAAKEFWMLYLFAGIFGFAYGGMQVLLSPMVADIFGLRSHGVILATTAFIGTIGAAIGPIIAGHIFDTSGSYNLAFIICAIMASTGFILTALLKPIKGNVKVG